MLWVIMFVLSAGVGGAAVSNVTVVGSTNVQSLIAYEAPSDDACLVEVSENPNYQPLVRDVDPAIFQGADLDTRQGNIAEGRNRVFLIGKRAVEQGADSKWHSRALQTDTVHYFRIRCGSDIATGAFRTANIPVGITWPWPIPQDPKTGHFRWPSLDGKDRNQTLIDPNYGTLIKRVSVPGDAPAAVDSRRKKFRSAAGANWTDPAFALTDDGNTARFSGATRDWLIVTDSELSALTSFFVGALGIDSITVRIKGSAQGDESQRRVDVCLTVDGVACNGEIRGATLESGGGTASLGGGPPLDVWGADTLWPDELARNKNFGVMIRSASDNATELSIEHIEVDVAFSEMVQMPEGGFVQVCSPVKSNGGYHCAFRSTLSTNHLFWFQPETGEARWLGKIVATGWGGPRTLCGSGFAMFDGRNPNVYYCQGTLEGKAVLLQGTYTGNDVSAQAGAEAPITWVNLTPSGNTIPDLIQRFDPEFDPARFTPSLGFIADRYAAFRAWSRGQDSIGWLAVFDIGNGQPIGNGGTGGIIAAAKSYASPNTRWCGIHTVEFVGHTNWFGWDANPVQSGNTDATGPFNVTTNTDVPPQTGTFTIQVSGEPQPYLMDTAVGDVFQYRGGQGFDFVRIVEKRSATEWVVERTVTGATPELRAAGSTLMAYCNARRLDMPRQGSYAYWDFINDPRGRDASGRAWLVEKIFTGGHIVQRGNYRIMEASDGYSVITPGIPHSFNTSRNYRMTGNPDWAGKQAALAGPGLGMAHQQHESYENYAAENGRSSWFVDMIPFVGATQLGSSVSRVEGFNQVYRVATTRLQSQAFPTFARCGGRQLKNLTPGPIGDQDSYAFCLGAGCVPGASESDIVVNCPAPVSETSRCTQSAAGDSASVCVSDLAPYSQSITQFFLDSSGARNRVLTNALYAWHSPRSRTYFDTAYSLPDGSWLLFASWGNNGRKDLYMLKVPARPEFDADPLSGSRPVTQTVSIEPPVGTEQVLLRYGVSGALSSAMEQTCRSGSPCSIQVAVKPLEIVFHKATYRDGGGQAVGESRTGALTSTGLNGAGVEKPKPKIRAENAVVNAFSFEPKLAPGTMGTVLGENLADCEESAGAPPLPKTLCNASVTFNGQAAPLFYAGPSQINVLLPSSLPPGSEVQVVVERSGEKSDAFKIPAGTLAEVAPAVAAYSLDGSPVRAAVQNPDKTISGPDRPELGLRPLKLGETAVVYANGLGPANPSVSDGDPAPADPPATAVNQADVFVNGVKQPVSSAALAAGQSGLYEVKFTLDPATPILDGAENRIWIVVKGVESPRVMLDIAGQ